jgi:hypothetical protein
VRRGDSESERIVKLLDSALAFGRDFGSDSWERRFGVTQYRRKLGL